MVETGPKPRADHKKQTIAVQQQEYRSHGFRCIKHLFLGTSIPSRSVSRNNTDAWLPRHVEIHVNWPGNQLMVWDMVSHLIFCNLGIPPFLLDHHSAAIVSRKSPTAASFL